MREILRTREFSNFHFSKGNPQIYPSNDLILRFDVRHGIVMKRYSLIEIIRRGRIDSARDGAFIIDGKEVSLFYFRCEFVAAYIPVIDLSRCYRAGYSPNDYPTSVEWDARILIEQSKAIKCPNIAYHLVGTKKVGGHILTSSY